MEKTSTRAKSRSFCILIPRIADAQVVGIPDERPGRDRSRADLGWKAGHDCCYSKREFAPFCRERLAYHKIPEHIRFVDSYPMTLSGKAQKFKMREFEISIRGLEAVANRQTA